MIWFNKTPNWQATTKENLEVKAEMTEGLRLRKGSFPGEIEVNEGETLTPYYLQIVSESFR